MRKAIALSAALALVLMACKKEEPVVLDLGFEYFPVAIGTWVEYQVDSVWRNDVLGIHDSVSYRLRERIEEHYIDPSGRPANRILRRVLDEEGNWVVRDVWTSTRDERAAEKTEENVRRLKLSFPVREARRWDTNVYNTVNELEVAYREAHKPWQINGMSFDSTVVVRGTVEPNIILRRDFEERYAKHVGMVEKRWVETNTQFPDTGVMSVIGFWLTMTVVDHGRD